MHEPPPITNAQRRIQVPPNSARAKLFALKSGALQLFKPGVLPVLALALIVGGWSYGYKLSHYLPNSGLTKASTTRMWLDQRQSSIAAPVSHHQSPQKLLAVALCLFAVPPLPHFAREHNLAEPLQPHAVEFVSTLHPLRAPPIYSLA